MQIIECWNIQDWDGGERHNHVFYITSEEEKEAYLAKNKHSLAFKQTLVVFDTLEEREANTTAKLRESALAKLTPLERKALGLYEQ